MSLYFALSLHLKVFADHHQVESDLVPKALQSTLDLFAGKLYPFTRVLVLANQDRAWLQPIQFIEVALMGDIAHKVINVRLFLFLPLVLFKDEGLGSAEAVMQLANVLRVTEGETPLLRRQLLRELVELLEAPFDGDGGIEEDR